MSLLLHKSVAAVSLNPKVCVLLPTYNGSRYLVEQLRSILDQRSVDVSVFISDDFSTDDTLQVIEQAFPNEMRIEVLPSVTRHGSAGKNFYSLIDAVDFTLFDYVSFADQDDVWDLDKLEASINALIEQGASGVSSDVVAFWEDGLSVYIRKSLPQKNYDYLFEPAGPGCTYVLTAEFAQKLKPLVSDKGVYRNVFNHDWLVYAYARLNGYPWYILPRSTMRYRQHDSNETGVNFGFGALKIRLRKLKSGFYLNQVYGVLGAVGRLDLLQKFFVSRGVPTLAFYRELFQMRRSSKEAVLWALFLLLRIPK